MDITYNGLSTSNGNLVTFTDIPNILKVEDDNTGGYATITLTFSGDISQLGEGYISILGETITGVLTYAEATNKNFFMSSSPTSVAASVTKALRNCPVIISNMVVKNDGNQVILKARSIGALFASFSDYFNTDIPSNYMSSVIVDGYSNGTLNGSLINVDVFSDGEYITSLEKNMYNGECAFNVSPVLTTFAEIGKTKPYTFSVSSIDLNGTYSSIETLNTNYISVGYMCNQGSKFIPLIYNGIVIAQNVSRGSQTGVYNHMPLYVYQMDSIPVSFYEDNLGGMNINIYYLNSAHEVIGSGSTEWHNTMSDKHLWDLNIVLDPTKTGSAFYIDIELGSSANTLRYNVIKPLKATEYSQRIYWRNSYGGVSFFDMTGQRSETREAEITTYQKNIFDYYDSPMNELEKVYDNDIKYSITLKSHLFEHDGKYIFNDLMQSPLVWTIINGEQYAIILDSVSVDEVENNDIYEATIKWHLSQEPSII